MELNTYAGDFRAFKALITAQIAGVAVKVNDVDPKNASPNSLPSLKTASGTITQSNAIARYIARSRPEAGLYGASFFQSGQVDQWIDFGTNNIELPAIITTYWQLGWQPFNFQANKKALEDLASGFAQLEAHLISQTYLVGQRLSLADVVIASQLFYPLKMSLDGAFRAQYPATIRWFSHVASLPAVNAVIGAVTFCAKAPSPPKNAKKEKAKGGGGKKQKKPKAKKEESEADKIEKAEAARKKAEAKKKNPLDLLPKSTLDLDEWKRKYSNSQSDYFASMKWFWENFDATGYSIWYQEFNHNDENTVNFVASNKIEGFCQRTEGIRKYSFGVMQLLNSKEKLGYYFVGGVWLIRGNEIKPMLETNPESGVYTWTRMDHTDAAAQQKIANYWCGETKIDMDYDCEDACVFK